MRTTYYHLESNKRRASQTTGFTLVEVLVSMSIFAIVVTMAVGTLLVLMDANAKAQSVQSVINNTSFVLDAMARDIRTGFYYYCRNTLPNNIFNNNNRSTNDCAGGASNFVFTESGNSLTNGTGSNRIGYRLQGTKIQRHLGTGGAGSWSDVTAPDVTIKTLDFVVTGTSNLVSNSVSPMVTIYVEGEVIDTAQNVTAFELQTTVTQQALDL